MWTKQSIFRRGLRADIDEIMEIERQPGYDRLVGRWSRAEHERNLRTPGALYLVAEGERRQLSAFAALSALGMPDGRVRLNRLIVRAPGRGVGRTFLSAIIDTVFTGTTGEEIWLNVASSNSVARDFYRRLGFVEQEAPRLRATTPSGENVDLIVMALFRQAWEAGITDPPPDCTG